MTTNTSDIKLWMEYELSHADRRKKERLEKLAVHLKRAEQYAHANALPVGSYQRQIAKRHERKLVAEAMHLGFQPANEEIIRELGIHLAGSSLGLSL